MVPFDELRQDYFTDADAEKTCQERSYAGEKGADYALFGLAILVDLTITTGDLANLCCRVHRIVVARFGKHVFWWRVTENNRAQNQHQQRVGAFQNRFLPLQDTEHQSADNGDRHRDAQERYCGLEVDQPFAIVANETRRKSEYFRHQGGTDRRRRRQGVFGAE